MDERSKGISFIAIAVALTALLFGQYYLFILQNDSDGPPYSGNTELRIGSLVNIDSLNPYVGLNDFSFFFYSLMYDGLVGIGQDLEPVPNLATGVWMVPESDPQMIQDGLPLGSVWQYNLTANAAWTDGEPFTADDVVYNINLNAQNYDFMWAFQPYSYFIQEAVEVDEYTVRVYFWDRETGDPMPCAFGGSIYIPMLPSHKLEGMSPEVIGFQWSGVFNDEEVPIVGTGPWMATEDIYSEWLEGDYITLVRNPNYHWGPDKGMEIPFDRIVLLFFDDETAMTYALRGAEIDVASYPPRNYRVISEDVASDNLTGIQTFDGPSPAMPFTYMSINLNEAGPNLARLDREVRRAMAMATNRSFIIENYLLGYAEEGSTLIPTVNSYWHYEPTEAERLDYDLEAARNLLEANGYIDIDSDGTREAMAWSDAVVNGWVAVNTSLEFELGVWRQYPEQKEMATYLRAVWEQIGIKLDVVILDDTVWPMYIYGYEYDLLIKTWSQDVDPNYMLFVESQLAWFGWSDTRYYNASYDENYLDSVSAMDPEERRVYANNCQRIFYGDVPYIILAYEDQTYAWRTDTFQGWGDWAAHPGRSLDSYWGGSPLFFDLQPILLVPCDCENQVVLGYALMVPTAVLALVFYALGIRCLIKSRKKPAMGPDSDQPGPPRS